MQKELMWYSKPCNKVKKAPWKSVRTRPKVAEDGDPEDKAAWDQVTVAPEESRTTVFRSGTEKELRGLSPRGGQQEPNSTLGDKEQCR